MYDIITHIVVATLETKVQNGQGSINLYSCSRTNGSNIASW